MADETYQDGTYHEPGSDRFVVASGGSLDVESGGEIDVESGGTLTVNGILTAATLRLAVTAVAAAGSTIGQGGDLVAGLNVVSAADNTKAVDLPTPVAGTIIVVSSQTANKTLPVFPAVNTSIDNLSNDAAKTIGAATATTSAIFVADNATHWVTVLGDTA